MKTGVSGGYSNSQNQEFVQAPFLLFMILLGRDTLKTGASKMNSVCGLSQDTQLLGLSLFWKIGLRRKNHLAHCFFHT